MPYLMESPTEGARLLVQGRASACRPALLEAGLAPGMRALDMGCGSGAVLPELLEVVGPSGEVWGVDPSPERLAEARRHVGDDARLSLRAAALPGTGLEGGRWDFVWSRFVLEYLADPRPALGELARLARPGGRVAICEVDRGGLDFWPVPAVVARGQGPFLAALARTGFDPEAGRKMFNHLRRLGLREVRVHASMLYLAAGSADPGLVADWSQRFQVLAPVAGPAFGAAADYQRFCEAYLGLLEDPDTLKFALVLTTSGTVP
jgi:ubiquinone/menaquinone biosynthesis C-methylase UbiE